MKRLLNIIESFTKSLTNTMSQHDVCWEITKKVIAHIGFEDCVVYLYDDELHVLEQVAAHGPKNPVDLDIFNPITIKPGQGIVGSAFESALPQIVQDTRLDSRYIIDDEMRLSEIAIPIIHEGKAIGVIDSEHSQVGFFTEDHLVILSALAAIASTKIVQVRAFEEIERYNRSLEHKITEATREIRTQKEEVERQKRRSDELLLNILPEQVAEELKERGEAEAKLIDNVTVLFTDFKGFTQLSEKLTPQVLVSKIHEYFSAFDAIIEKYGIEKIKTIGDAYMAAGGVPEMNETHAWDVMMAAMEINTYMKEQRSIRLAKGESFFEIRIGVHTGPVVAGIVGVRKFQYDIWGDTVNTASRMESAGEPGKINISESTYELIKDQFACEYRGEIDAKGKGKMKMYFVSDVSRA